MTRMNNRIPDGWEEISSIGGVVEGTRFIAFRAPLSWRSDWNLARLKETVRAETGHELTHIIDLTHTDRYYSPSLCTSLGISHTKIHVPGHVIPGQELVDQFYRAVEAASKDEEGLIGVHCTHGLNRSDYVGTQSIPKIHDLFHLSTFYFIILRSIR